MLNPACIGKTTAGPSTFSSFLSLREGKALRVALDGTVDGVQIMGYGNHGAALWFLFCIV